MSGEGSELNLNSPQKKCAFERGRRCEDRISELPDDIIIAILSSLPLKNAAATSLVSRRWKHLWKHTPNLVFIYDYTSSPYPYEVRSLRRTLKNIKWVNSAIRSHKALYLKQFTISFLLHRDSKNRQPLAKWLQFAFSKRVENLKLDSNFFLDSDIVFPSFNQTSTTTVAVFLRVLKLRCSSMSGEAIQLFLSNCPLLERLTVYADFFTSDVVVVGATRLKYLGITSARYGISVKVSAPNLTRLKCKFKLMTLFLDENVPDLVDASFRISGPEDTMQRFANVATRLEILTIFLYDRYHDTSSIGNAFAVPKMPKLKKLVLHYDSDAHTEFLLLANRFLRASPCLEEFRLKIAGYPCGDEPGSRFEVNQTNAVLGNAHVGNRLEQHSFGVTVFEFGGFCGGRCAAHHMEMVSYIVDNCVALDEIIIIPEFSLADSKFFATSLAETAYIKAHTEQLLAGKVPHHIKLRIHV